MICIWGKNKILKMKETSGKFFCYRKNHVGEFQTLLLQLDKEQLRELEEGKKEVEEITKKKM